VNLAPAQPVRLAAVGDLHVTPRTRRTLGELARVREDADVLLLAGDLTTAGRLGEARVLADGLAGVGVPVVAVLGNHDHDDDKAAQIGAMLRDAGVAVLDGTCVTLDVRGVSVGIAGVIGCGGGFGPTSEDSAGRAQAQAARLRQALESLDTSVRGLRVALTHFAPVPGTLAGEPLDIYRFLGSDLLGRAIDSAGADLAVHGHAHLGTEHGSTPGGIPVRNVARPVLDRPYAVYSLSPGGSLSEVASADVGGLGG
jgi:Icc-related predicted phosphoesterase